MIDKQDARLEAIQADMLADIQEWLNEVEPTWNLDKEESRPQSNQSLYDHNYLTLDKEPQVEAVRLYKASKKFVHPDERRHALLHQHFCKKAYCKYHWDY
jgi:hypothetical protein